MVQLAQFDPAGEFQSKRRNALSIQGQEQAIDREARQAPIRNELAQLQLGQTRESVSRGTKRNEISDMQEKAGITNNVQKALRALPFERRRQAVESLKPQLSAFGIDLSNLPDEQLTDAALDEGIIATGAFVQNPEQESAKFSAKTEILEDGSSIALDTKGRRVVRDKSGNVVTGEKAATIIKKGNEEGIRIQTERAGGRAEATKREARASELIDRGLAAAESTAGLRRGLELLKTIRTGGPQSISLAVKQRLGIEGADEAELSQSLAKAVLSQLRETFGAAFTENEGLRLERIEGSFGKSTPANERLLGQALRLAERTATRARKAAEERGDTSTVEDIDDLLSFSLTPEREDASAEQPAAVQSATIGRFQVEAVP